MDLPAGPRAPAAWQTVAWMVRPGAFLSRAHAQFGDPVTIRTYWTEEPMVLFSGPDAVRDVFGLDPAIAPAGQSWEFLRPFAGPHSILLLDGEEHLRERRVMQAPFHGERMRAFAPMVGELARQELSTWGGHVNALERMRELTLEIILRVVFGARGDQEAARLRDGVEGALAGVRSMPRMLAMALVRRDLCRAPLAVRNRRPGDRFRPVGLDGQKKLQDFFVDRKIARGTRDAVPLVVDDTDRIVWVAGYGIDEAFRVTDAAQEVIILKLRQA